MSEQETDEVGRIIDKSLRGGGNPADICRQAEELEELADLYEELGLDAIKGTGMSVDQLRKRAKRHRVQAFHIDQGMKNPEEHKKN